MGGQGRAREARIAGIERLDAIVERAAPVHGIGQMRGGGAAKGFDQRGRGPAMAAMDGQHRLVVDHGVSFFFLPQGEKALAGSLRRAIFRHKRSGFDKRRLGARLEVS